ncbi:MAG: hypothetical protein C4519_02780, partial [Desulfobacteraceae bacterium]
IEPCSFLDTGGNPRRNESRTLNGFAHMRLRSFLTRSIRAPESLTTDALTKAYCPFSIPIQIPLPTPPECVFMFQIG